MKTFADCIRPYFSVGYVILIAVVILRRWDRKTIGIFRNFISRMGDQVWKGETIQAHGTYIQKRTAKNIDGAG